MLLRMRLRPLMLLLCGTRLMLLGTRFPLRLRTLLHRVGLLHLMLRFSLVLLHRVRRLLLMLRLGLVLLHGMLRLPRMRLGLLMLFRGVRWLHLMLRLGRALLHGLLRTPFRSPHAIGVILRWRGSNFRRTLGSTLRVNSFRRRRRRLRSTRLAIFGHLRLRYARRLGMALGGAFGRALGRSAIVGGKGTRRG